MDDGWGGTRDDAVVSLFLTQAVGHGRIARADGWGYSTCDGVQHRITVPVVATDLAYRRGPAVVQADLSVGGSQQAEELTTVRVR